MQSRCAIHRVTIITGIGDDNTQDKKSLVKFIRAPKG